MSFLRWSTEKLLDFLKDVKRIGFLGFGKSNRAVFDLLSGHFDFEAIVREERASRGGLPCGVEILLGERCFEPAGEDIIFVSPSVRRERAEVARLLGRVGRVSSDAELFFALNGTPTLAVSGSDGKSTTVKMAEAILNLGGVSALACGNIGLPFVSALESGAECFVTELSSFSLEYMKPPSVRAVITNITENHLDWHGSFESYIAAKEALLENAEEAILSPDSEACIPLIRQHKPPILFSVRKSYAELRGEFGFCERYYTLEDGYLTKNGERLIAVSALSKKEPHNIKNALAAIALTDGMFDTGGGIEALSDFSGLAHRIEGFTAVGGVRYVDSSIDSTPERTAATLRVMPRRVIVLLGGRGKGLSYAPLAEALGEKSGEIIIYGENREEIYATLADAGLSDRIILAEALADATELAMAVAAEGDTVLLSPASTSYDAFSDFEERGNKFKEFVKRKDKK